MYKMLKLFFLVIDMMFDNIIFIHVGQYVYV